MNDTKINHLPVFTVMNFNCWSNKHNEMYKICRKLNELNVTKFQTELENYNWEELYKLKDVNDSYNYFIKIVKELYDKHYPLTKIKIKNKNMDKPWLTKGLIICCHRKNNLYKRYVKNNCRVNDEKYKSYKNKLTPMLRCSEKAYYKNVL